MTAASGEEARTNGRQVSGYQSGMCQKFVRAQCWEVGSLYGSAIEAWNGAREKHPGDRSPPIGAPCYYKGGHYGHAVIFTGGSDIRSTDCHSAGKVSEDDLSWPERTWGYVYLGWTGDINGVDLPIGEDEDDMKPEDWTRMERLIASVWEEKMTVTQPGSGQDTAKSRQQVLRELWQKVTKAT